MKDNDQSSIVTLIAGVGLGLGVAAWFFGKDGKNMKMVKEKATELGDRLTETWEDSQENIQELFGEANAQTQLVYMKTRQQLNGQVREIVDEFGKISKDKYNKLVTDVLADLQENKSLSPEHMKTLKKFLSDDYNRLQKKISA